MRHARIVVSAAVLAGAVGFVAAPAPAQAGPPPPPAIEGYVWGNEPANPNYFPATGYEHNSAGGAIQIIRNVVGVYQVRFLGMAGTGGVAHASAYGSNAVCTVGAYGPRLADEWVYVRCFDTDGDPVDTRFVANVTNRQPAGASFGYLWNDNPTPPVGGHVPPAQWSYDSAGKPIVVHRSAVGHYEVELGAFAQDSPGPWANGSLRVTAYGTSSRHCQVLDPDFVPDHERAWVLCFDDTGYAVDTRFTLTYARGVTPLGAVGPRATATVEHLVAVPALRGWTNTAGGAPAAAELALGSYLVSFPNTGAPRGHAIASIMGTPPMYCNIHAWWSAAGTEHVWLRCYDGGIGVPTPAVLFNVAFIP
jgi:hypothetical protein